MMGTHGAQRPDSRGRARYREKNMTSSVNISSRFAALHEMHGRGHDHPRDIWVANMEAAAALLIALGCLLAFGVQVGILQDTGVTGWAIDCLFPLQFPVFYFASGYLYQRHRNARTWPAWAANLRREAVVLLVPFAVFTVLALLANTAAGLGRPFTLLNLVDALLVSPVEPFGYLYTSFLLFAITPTVISHRGTHGLLIAAFGCKVAIVVALSVPLTAEGAAQLPYAITSIAENWIWFAGGMAIALFGALPLLRGREKAWAWGALWFAASIITFIAGWLGEASHGVLDAIGIVWFASLFSTVFRAGAQNAFFDFASRYTMAFWLIPPIALKLVTAAMAAAGATVVGTPWVWLAAAAFASFVLPVLVMALLNRCGKAAVVVYPARYLPPVPALIEKRTAN